VAVGAGFGFGAGFGLGACLASNSLILSRAFGTFFLGSYFLIGAVVPPSPARGSTVVSSRAGAIVVSVGNPIAVLSVAPSVVSTPATIDGSVLAPGTGPSPPGTGPTWEADSFFFQASTYSSTRLGSFKT